MLSIYLAQFLVITFFGAVRGDPTIEIIIEEASTRTEDNEYFDPWEASLTPGLTDRITLKVPVKKDLPPDLVLRIVLGIAGQELVNIEEPLCEAFEDDIVGTDIIAAGIPKEIFPKKCPLPKGADWEIHEWIFPVEKLPPGIPDGPCQGTLSVFEPGKPPIAVLSSSGRITHHIPSMSSMPALPSMPQLPSVPLRG